MKNVLMLLLTLSLFMSSNLMSAKQKCGDDAYWSLKKGILTINGKGAIDGRATAEWINKAEYVFIGDGINAIYGSFRNCINIKSVDIPNSVTFVGSETFSGCINLNQIKIPSSVHTIAGGAFSKCIKLDTIKIPNSIELIGDHAFSECDNLKFISLPNKVIKMGHHAFCHLINLKEIIIPDSAPIEISSIVYPDCKPIDLYDSPNNISIKGYNISCPSYIIKYLPLEKQDLIKNSFSYYANEMINEQIRQWAKKKEFETTNQWKDRVNAENQKKQALILINEAKKSFISERTPKFTTGSLQKYDADQNAYPVSLNCGKTVYAKIPLNDAKFFKSHWKDVIIEPTYGIVNDQLSITSCKFKLKGKEYELVKNYIEDNSKDLSLSLPDITFETESPIQDDNKQIATADDSSVDQDIPVTEEANNNTFAVIIGNENYQRVAKVQYANNDAKVFSEYCQKTLGLPKANIRSYKDATYGMMISALKDIQAIAKAYKGNIDVIFYYAGHGVPNESNQSAYLLPIDADGTQTEVCLSTKKLYETLNSLEARQVIVLMDACFSGTQRGDGMLTANRGVSLKVKNDVPTGNIVVYTAANGQQTAYPYIEKKHGIFTYFLLKKLQETKGDVNLGELTDYVSEQVAKRSAVVNKRIQTPTVIFSQLLTDSWRCLRLQ